MLRHITYGKNLHIWLSACLAGLAPWFLWHLHLPFAFDWEGLAFAYWLLLGAQSIFVAALLYLAGSASWQLLAAYAERLRRNKIKAFLLLAYFVLLARAIGGVKAFVLTVDTIAILELLRLWNAPRLRKAVANVLLPAAYLFFGFLLVFAYNDIILSTRFFAADDVAFSRIDLALLNGISVSAMSHWAVRTFPLPFFQFLEFIYFGMFPQIGAALILTTLSCGRRRGLQFVGTIMMAYYLTLGLFYLWPSQGPYYLCSSHFEEFPAALRTYSAQRNSILVSQALSNHVPFARISFHYFIAFPCMHIAQPLVVAWFLRGWKRILLTLLCYDCFLLVAIVLLEWHYVVDILGGVVVAFLTVLIVDFPFRRAISTVEIPSHA